MAWCSRLAYMHAACAQVSVVLAVYCICQHVCLYVSCAARCQKRTSYMCMWHCERGDMVLRAASPCYFAGTRVEWIWFTH